MRSITGRQKERKGVKMAKGNYYKYKTKKFFEEQGYSVDFLERTYRVYAKGKLIPVKKDVFASDVLAMGNGEIIFVQVKGGKSTTGINIKKAIEEFNKYPFPDYVKRIIVIWRERAREPELLEVNNETLNTTTGNT